jgi:hypothetical protein
VLGTFEDRGGNPGERASRCDLGFLTQIDIPKVQLPARPSAIVAFWGMLIEPWLVLTLCRLLCPFLGVNRVNFRALEM